MKVILTNRYLLLLIVICLLPFFNEKSTSKNVNGKNISEKRLNGKFYTTQDYGYNWKEINEMKPFRKIIEKRLNNKYYLSIDQGHSWIEIQKNSVGETIIQERLSDQLLVVNYNIDKTIRYSFNQLEEQNIDITVFDILGNCVLKKNEIVKSNQTYNLSLQFLSKGIYLMLIYYSKDRRFEYCQLIF